MQSKDHFTRDAALETLLHSDLLQPPADFTAQVMRNLHDLPLPFAAIPPTTAQPKRWEWLQWLALVGGALFSLEQLASYAFGIWFVTSIG
ncbi:MAG: hypothetical protein RI964_879 [Pseudomonadota bacterium]|jgi:hypothetical protein